MRLEEPQEQIYLFFDEINTANCMGLFKECLCDRSCDGIPFPPNVAIIGACNPYRFRVETENRAVSGLIFKYNSPQNALGASPLGLLGVPHSSSHGHARVGLWFFIYQRKSICSFHRPQPDP
eukprot:17449_6